MRLPVDALVLLSLILGTPVFAAMVLGWVLFRKVLRRTLTRLERGALRAAFAVLAVYILAFAYGSLIEADWVDRTTMIIPVREPVLGKDRFRIVHLSDLHVRAFGGRERRVLELVREARPDLILITGDIGDHPGDFAALAKLRKELDAPFGVFGVRGNDDHDVAALTSAGYELLRDGTRILERDGRRLCLAGRDHPSRVSLRRILDGQPEGAVTIFLQHLPEGVDQLSRLGPGQHVDLFLCGHTHGGQICLPFWGAVLTKSKYHKKYERGLYHVNGVPMVVSRGVGTSNVPARFLCRPEVGVIDLVVSGAPTLPNSR